MPLQFDPPCHCGKNHWKIRGMCPDELAKIEAKLRQPTYPAPRMADPEPEPLPELVPIPGPKRDRRTYQREWMRRRREIERKAKGLPPSKPRAPAGSFDVKAYQREWVRARRAALRTVQ